MTIAASILVLALTRAEIIDRFRAAPVTQLDGLVQVYGDCPADMRREFQLPIASFVSGICRKLYAADNRRPVKFGEPGIIVRIGDVRTNIAEHLTNPICERNCYKFCWIVDFPFFEKDEETGKIIFSHNPFSMPQGGLEALNTKPPLEIEAYQYDVVCNGIELSSGAIRNHLPEVMYKAFEIAGYPKETVEQKFGALHNAFQYGAPPHGGIAPGVDRMVMLLADTPNIREVIAFPMNQKAQDLMMQAPNYVTEQQLRELHIKIRGTNAEAQA